MAVTVTDEDIRNVQDKLFDWERSENPVAPLTSDQIDALQDLEEEFSKFEFFGDLSISQEDDLHQSALNVVRQSDGDVGKCFVNLLQSKSRIETTRQFLSWYSDVEEELLHEEDVQYTQFMKQLTERKDECTVLLTQIEAALGDLTHLTGQYQSVSSRTNSLHQVSEQLLADQVKLNGLYEEVNKRLQYFTSVDSLSSRLASPTLSVASDAFVDILNRLDECIEYMTVHIKWKESNTYLVKYKHCLSRAIALMRSYVIDAFQHATQQVLAPRAVGGNQTEQLERDTSFALCYGKFQASAPKVKQVIIQIEERVARNQEYENLLAECHHSYFSQREQLLGTGVATAVSELAGQHRGDHCSLVRSGCAFLVHVCHDEYQLFYQFFTLHTPQLTTYLEGLCTSLYDVLRPFIIHINHLETLAEVCSILRLEMLEEHVQNNPGPLEAFSKIAWQLLQDVQERLVFRAHCYLQSDILQYRPAPGDLAYPEKLEMMESIAQSLQDQTPQSLRRSDSRSSIVSVGSATSQEVARINSDNTVEQPRSRTGNSPADLHGMWYPTVRRTLVCLSRLYRCVDRTIFQGLSQEALSVCIQSVASASQAITARKSPIDGELFQIKHLLILREQIAPFQVDFTIKEMSLDFSKMKTAAFSLLQKKRRLFSLGTNNALLEFLLEGTPQVKEQLLDSRKEVDRQLKASCEAFINHATSQLADPVLAFLQKAQVFSSMSAEVQNVKLSQQPFAHPAAVSEIVAETKRLIKAKLPNVQRSMQLYLANRETEFILFRPIKNNVLALLARLEQILANGGYSAEDLLVIACPTPEQAAVLLSSASLMPGDSVREEQLDATT
ncbi:conserved oligomeric Golgi complex subunit 3 [Schistocerca serialis cubense]|uniref:conserved oligomeric Golgi complex subunit 3 n=1 Tax=Schistocerca serialis cubense TaxID=2023355 RepID=UPI00214E6D44|nr:conserved oligomeric Golgi complex subunit 3 [Schistocerca serialis cubense]